MCYTAMCYTDVLHTCVTQPCVTQTCYTDTCYTDMLHTCVTQPCVTQTCYTDMCYTDMCYTDMCYTDMCYTAMCVQYVSWNVWRLMNNVLLHNGLYIYIYDKVRLHLGWQNGQHHFMEPLKWHFPRLQWCHVWPLCVQVVYLTHWVRVHLGGL